MHRCPKCGAEIEDGKGCPSCLAKVEDRGASPDTAHAELARANLLRLRGDYTQAEAICLGVLRNFPNSVAAHTLLGDIHVDAGNHEQAAKWLELALGLDPSLVQERQKLDRLKQHLNGVEESRTVAELGLPERSRLSWVTAGLGGLAVLAIVVALALGLTRRPEPKADVPSVVSEAISATPDTVAAIEPSAKTEPSPSVRRDERAGPTSTPATPAEDQALYRSVSQRSVVGASLVGVTLDPRSKLAILTYVLADGDDIRRIGAELARIALDQSPDTLTVTLRGMQEGKLVYIADVPRARYAETTDPNWQPEVPGQGDAWIAHILTNEWTGRPTVAP